ncbi:MAG: TIGR02221 family CRISPR-associated protein [Bacteroidales bacterium]|nr:TIGR02221 family CRISPR-associated protein [Bacteroidales bacterium]MCM1147754.1 TIGR02221 family CRISPR-associated protein [Bacteroidales bacterium]MCM1206636.1 TIGR02221 family CRISPR-associated protein [Bacillota bacterium]MCM1510623.1 TIGR02221 family CRISPR-associated protein [Clostridium sp.]
MARKVFLSVLGTGFYGKCRYRKNDFLSSETRFIQQAMLEYHDVKSWTEDCAAYILLTSKAKATNWIVPGNERYNFHEQKNEAYKGLCDVIEDMDLPINVQAVDIVEGKDESEMWEIFNTVYEILQDGDEVYFDLTHGFRYLPMLVLVLGNYAKFLKNISVKGISYGNYESRNDGEAPIVDLLPLSLLQDWTHAAADFIENGSVSQLVELSRHQTSSILRNNNKDESARNLNAFVKGLGTFVDEMKFCRGVDIYNATTLKKLLATSETISSTFIQPLNPVMDKIKMSLNGFVAGKSAKNCLMAAKWCADNGMYQTAITELQEGIVTFFCERNNIPVDNETMRGTVNAACAVKGENRENNITDAELLKLSKKVECDERLTESLARNFCHLTRLRNDFNHSGMRNNPQSIDKLKRNIKKYVDKIIAELCDNKEPDNTAEAEPKAELCDNKESVNTPKLLINLSNHPSSEWSEEQLSAAMEYGKCIDIPFPNVDPFDDEDAISELADKKIAEILTLVKDNKVTVHIMGEMCLTFQIVSKLHQHGIKCISSTTYRIAEILPDGSKRIEFHFKRFRDYGK